MRLNQIGLLPDEPKRALLPSQAATPLPWRLLDEAEQPRAQGETVVIGPDAASGETLHLIDFSGFDGTGSGFRLEAGAARSRPFRIAPDLYARLPFDALAYFYHNRAGTPIEARHAGGERWARPAAHRPERATCFAGEDEVGQSWSGCDYRLDVTGGWYDAGDHGKYVVNGGIALWTLLNAYERSRQGGGASLFRDGSAEIPEAGNGVDDLLDEARWEMEFLLSMQVPEGTRLRLPLGPHRRGERLTFTEVDASGMAHHKVADERWTALPMPPHLDRERRFLYPPSTGATLNLAATAAQCARIWREVDPAFASRCLAAAERAFAAALRHPQVHAGNFAGSGSYGDRSFTDEHYWAAAELLVTTGRDEYAEAVRRSPHFAGEVDAAGWASTATLGTITVALAPGALPEGERQAQRARLVAAADRYLAERERIGYRIPYAPPYPWGSNAVLLNRAMILALAHDFTGEARYRGGVVDSMDYLLGRNPLDQSYVSGYGARPMRHPHHRFWAHSLDPQLPPPPPGALSGGPNDGRPAEEVARAIQGCAPQACWRDDIGAFSLNEVAINWNAPLVWVAAWLAEGD
nr:glycoside hydrolase family 9 protein [Sphingosinicella terrae]